MREALLSFVQLILFASVIVAAHGTEISDWRFTWNESIQWNRERDLKMAYTNKVSSGHDKSAPPESLDGGGTEGSNLIGGLPVYVSLTTIANRLHLLSPTIQSIISGSVVPSMIYIFISPDPHLIDTGITESDIMNEEMKLVQLLDYFHNIKFVFTENIGPHRKVLPLLYHKQREDCVIISVDDDHIYLHHWLRDMLAYYVHSQGQAVISTRARRIAICSGRSPYHIAPYMHFTGTAYHTQWYEAAPHVHEMLLLPTGVGGVLYRPRFFNLSVVFNRELWSHTLRADDLTFRLATLANNIPVFTACVHGDYKDNKLITKCPALSGVAFQHLARRRLAVNASDAQLQGLRIEEMQSKEMPNLRGSPAAANTNHHYHHHAGPSEQRRASHALSHTSIRGSYDVLRGRMTRRPRPRHAPEEQLEQYLYRNLHSTDSGRGTPGGSNGSAMVGWVEVPSPGAPRNGSSGSSGSATDGTDINERSQRSSLNITHEHNVEHSPVYNRSKLMVIGSLKPPAKNIDHGKQGSLSSINSKHDGNFHQWNKATEFLKKKGLFDVDSLVQQYVRRERTACVATTLLLHYDNRTWVGSLVGAVASNLQALQEGWSDGHCGVVTCHA